ncbi:hypothetical protein ACJVDH_05945 [Pedobacter sp. AW1-32]|uniref:hypothetical protein n=1 Tax=Pedobacter sp. AW1-32 TaxID=3383026 RepID=UPI003FEEAEF2
MNTKSKLICCLGAFAALIVTENALAQDQTVNGNLSIGAGSHSALGYGSKIFFLGNSDDCFIGRYNVAENQTQFRFNIGDDLQPEDKFVVGVNYGNNTWYPRFAVQGDGNVGIGTENATARLRVVGGATVLGQNARPTNTDGHLSIGNILEDSSPQGSDWSDRTTLLLSAANFTTIGFHDSDYRVDFIRSGNGTIELGYDGGYGKANIGLPGGIWNSSGNVGIGTATPSDKLSVNGNIRAREIKVDSEHWPDYVFEPNYKITPLAEIETFIKLHKHLPEMPSAKEVADNGIALGEMNKLLLKKIEELTLHLIAKDKENEALQLRELERDRKYEQQIEQILTLIKTKNDKK